MTIGNKLGLEIIPVVHLGRSGSTYLEQCLTSAFRLISLSEVFHRDVSMPFLPDGVAWQEVFGNGIECFLLHNVLRGMEQHYWTAQSKGLNPGVSSHLLLEYKPTLVGHAFHAIHSQVFLKLKEGSRYLVKRKDKTMSKFYEMFFEFPYLLYHLFIFEIKSFILVMKLRYLLFKHRILISSQRKTLQ